MAGRRGVTLVELMVALAVGGLVVALSSTIVSSLVTTRSIVERLPSERANAANSLRTLRKWMGNTQIGTPADSGFWSPAERPSNSQLRFATWMRRPDGGWEHAIVRLHVRATRLQAEVSRPRQSLETVVLREGVSELRFAFLNAGHEGGWQHQWDSPSLAPVAVRMQLTAQRRNEEHTFVIGAR